MSKGISSYDELAKKLQVNRSTVYRRVRTLERNNMITNQTRASVNFEKLDLLTIMIGLNVSNANAEQVINFLSTYPCVKMVLQSFGTYNLFVIIFCEKGEEGNRIFEIRRILEEFNVISFDASVGFKWRKMEMTPF